MPCPRTVNSTMTKLVGLQFGDQSRAHCSACVLSVHAVLFSIQLNLLIAKLIALPRLFFKKCFYLVDVILGFSMP